MPSTSADVPRHGRRSAPPGSALAPPTVSLPTYPSSTLNNYYNPSASHSASFVPHVQNNVPLSYSHFYDPNILPPSVSQSRVPSLRRTPSSPLRPVSSTRSSLSHTSLSPLIFQPPSPNTHIQNFNTVEPRRHSIFSPQIINSPLPNVAYSSPARPPSTRLPTPNNIPQPIQPVPMHPILP